jgi:hypothetical protein
MSARVETVSIDDPASEIELSKQRREEETVIAEEGRQQARMRREARQAKR